MTVGNIYILINASMPNYVKIGKTVQRVEERMRSLDSTRVSLPFECFFAARVEDIDFMKRQLHDAFGDQRVRKNREFFETDPARVAVQLSSLRMALRVESLTEKLD